MKFKTTQQGGVTVIAVQGSLMGGPDATELNKKIHELIEGGKKLVVLDLAGVEFINSSGLGMLINSASALKEAGGRLRVANASAKILTIIKITKLAPILGTHDSVQDAIAELKK
jgi:anti-sigma B factor antagonist